jgi:type II secretory pathway pseudopilin PulG
MRSAPFAEGGFSALEVLVIVVIVCVVAAIGVPTLRDRAKASVLEVNLESLGSLVAEQAMQDYDPDYRASGDGDPTRYLSTHLEELLNIAGESGYVNPIVGSQNGRVVLNSRTLPTDARSVPPAVFMTDATQCQYVFFSALSDTSRRALAGTLIVAFNREARTVDVFFVEADGQKSANVVSVPTR